MNAHRERAYPPGTWRCADGCDRADCPHLRSSELAQDTTIVLPLFHQMTADDQDRVVGRFGKRSTRMNGGRRRLVA